MVVVRDDFVPSQQTPTEIASRMIKLSWVYDSLRNYAPIELSAKYRVFPQLRVPKVLSMFTDHSVTQSSPFSYMKIHQLDSSDDEDSFEFLTQKPYALALEDNESDNDTNRDADKQIALASKMLGLNETVIKKTLFGCNGKWADLFAVANDLEQSRKSYFNNRDDAIIMNELFPDKRVGVPEAKDEFEKQYSSIASMIFVRGADKVRERREFLEKVSKQVEETLLNHYLNLDLLFTNDDFSTRLPVY